MPQNSLEPPVQPLCGLAKDGHNGWLAFRKLLSHLQKITALSL
jgi:hypothetical protein